MAVSLFNNDLDDVVRVTPQFFAFLACVDKWYGKSFQWVLRTVKILGVSCKLTVIPFCLV